MAFTAAIKEYFSETKRPKPKQVAI
jgi:hypothetical protein